MSVPCGKIAGIHHIDVVQFLCRGASTAITGGKFGADTDMNHSVVRFTQFGEQFIIIRDIDGGCGTQFATGGNMRKNIFGLNFNGIFVVRVPF